MYFSFTPWDVHSRVPHQGSSAESLKEAQYKPGPSAKNKDRLLWACFSLRLKQITIYVCLSHPESVKCFSLSLGLVWLLFFRTWRGSNPWNLLHSNGVPLISVEFRQSRLPPCRGSQRTRLGAQAHVKGLGPGKWRIFSNVCCHRPSKIEMLFLQTEYFLQNIRFLCLKGDL